jgi:hypothetical protein
MRRVALQIEPRNERDAREHMRYPPSATAIGSRPTLDGCSRHATVDAAKSTLDRFARALTKLKGLQRFTAAL